MTVLKEADLQQGPITGINLKSETVKQILLIWAGFFLCLTWMLPTNAQVSWPVKTQISGENLHLFSDRSMYGVSETIYYSVFYENSPENPHNNWSTVLYTELLRWDGTSLAQSKVPIINNNANGSLKIPDNIPTGNYYLRTYTRWMRNYSPYNYCHEVIKIVNTSSDNLVKGPVNQNGELQPKAEIISVADENSIISGIAETYSKRQQVDFEIELQENDLSTVFCLAISKISDDVPKNSFTFSEIAKNEKLTEIEFLPEVMGISLSGRVIDEITMQPLSNKQVILSSFSESFLFLAKSTDKHGSFQFNLPHYSGTHEFHITVSGDSSDNARVQVAGDFCTSPVTLPFIPFSLTEEEKIIAGEIALNTRLSDIFWTTEPETFSESETALPFYGPPTFVVKEKDFIELKNLKEFFFELVQPVTIGYNNRMPYLIVNAQGNLGFAPPLLLIDNIPVANDEKLLNIPSRRIDRVEVINKGYVVGEYKYSGLISIYSNNKDLAGYELSGDSHFFNYRLFDKPVETGSIATFTQGNHQMPDRRNLLYWDPFLKVEASEPVSIRFITPDAPGRYLILIRGWNQDTNTVIYSIKEFSVE